MEDEEHVMMECEGMNDTVDNVLKRRSRGRGVGMVGSIWEERHFLL